MVLTARKDTMARSSFFLLYRIMPCLVLGLLSVVCRFQGLEQEVLVHLGKVGLSVLNSGDILVSEKQL